MAGQTVPHVHIHILPRKTGDFEKNDEVYDAIDEATKGMQMCAAEVCACWYPDVQLDESATFVHQGS